MKYGKRYELWCPVRKGESLKCRLRIEEWDKSIDDWKLISEKWIEVPTKEFSEVIVSSDYPFRVHKTPFGVNVSIWKKPAFLPEICVEEKGKRVCNEEVPFGDLIVIMMDLVEAEKLKPGFLDFLTTHGIRVVDKKDLYEDTGATGWAELLTRSIVYDRDSSRNPVKTLLHEYAHFREEIAREEKGLPRGKGEWRRVEGRFVPVGAELRAEKFAKRVTSRK